MRVKVHSRKGEGVMEELQVIDAVLVFNYWSGLTRVCWEGLLGIVGFRLVGDSSRVFRRTCIHIFIILLYVDIQQFISI